MSGSSFNCQHLFYTFFKKHSCPNCGNKLSKKTVSQILNSKSPLAKKCDFEVADIIVKGNMKFTHIVLSCDACKKTFTVKELKRKL